MSGKQDASFKHAALFLTLLKLFGTLIDYISTCQYIMKHLQINSVHLLYHYTSGVWRSFCLEYYMFSLSGK